MAVTKEEIKKQKLKRIGEVNVNSYGSKMTIIEYNGVRNITVKFDNDYKVKTKYESFKNGSVSNPYDKSLYNIGYLGDGDYKPSVDNANTIQYNYWREMLKRCYDEKSLKKDYQYKDKYVCEEWHCFQTFAKWFDENYYECNDETMQIDKDIIQKGNKIYSPETCIFVPQRINNLFTKSDKARGEYPIGVCYHKRLNKFQANCSIIIDNKKKQKFLGSYDTPEYAFYDGYKPFKELYIKGVANEYKSKIPFKLYEAMYKWVVEIDD